MRIVVTGLVARFPLGGVAWDYLAYVDGFRRLGCDVLYLEDTGQWLYDPARETYTDEQVLSVTLIRRHDRFFTFAENIGQPNCMVPTGGLSWIPTRQPVVLERWPFSFSADATRFTTVMSWKTDVSLPRIDGIRHGGKGEEFMRFAELARRTRVPMEIAVSGAAPLDRLRGLGWHLTSAREKSATMDTYRAYLAGSRGEWSVSKNVYVALRSGWFSCRSAVYLALGKPVVVQDTGWSRHYPTGAGLFAFDTPDQAAAALETANRDYRRQCDAARAVAEREFAADTVLERLLADSGLT